MLNINLNKMLMQIEQAYRTGAPSDMAACGTEPATHQHCPVCTGTQGRGSLCQTHGNLTLAEHLLMIPGIGMQFFHQLCLMN